MPYKYMGQAMRKWRVRQIPLSRLEQGLNDLEAEGFALFGVVVLGDKRAAELRTDFVLIAFKAVTPEIVTPVPLLTMNTTNAQSVLTDNHEMKE